MPKCEALEKEITMQRVLVVDDDKVLQSSYGDMMNSNSHQQSVNSNDPVSQFVNKDYRAVLKAAEKKSGR